MINCRISNSESAIKSIGVIRRGNKTNQQTKEREVNFKDATLFES